jgi:hypothetical protein
MGLERTALLALLKGLHLNLATHADDYRGDRDPEDQDLFRYEMTVPDRGDLRVFRFRVNDAFATGYLRVESVEEVS